MIETRQLLTLKQSDIIVQATCHWPADGQEVKGKTGVIFLNGLAATRAGYGDAAVYWADHFAHLGYPSFRLDLPGYGDSAGPIPDDWLDHINRGGYGSIVSAKIRELLGRFKLSGVVIVGHCAGTVSAIFAAASNRDCHGLILLDPYFDFRQASLQPKLRTQLSLWAAKSRFGGALSKSVKYIRNGRFLREANGLPENANVPLLRRWKDVTSAGLPVLMLRAPGLGTDRTNSHVREFDYLEHACSLAGSRSRVTMRTVSGANHSFANAVGRSTVHQLCEGWLTAYFPCKQSAVIDRNAVTLQQEQMSV